MEIRYAKHPDDFAKMHTEQIRADFLMEGLFEEGQVNIVYIHDDRMIAGGAVPLDIPLKMTETAELGVSYLLENRELGMINIGGAGGLKIGDALIELSQYDGYYLGKGTKEFEFQSKDSANPAKFYFISVPAHHTYPNTELPFENLMHIEAGESEALNRRKIYQYIFPGVCESSNLQMGYTVIAPGSGWNRMPTHLQEHRTEIDLYLEMNEDTRVFHFLGRPEATRHLIVKNEEAVLSPSWSIQAGVGTKQYAYIWATAGDNLNNGDVEIIHMDSMM